MQLGIHDPRFVGLLLLAGFLATSILIPSFFMEVALTIATSAVLAPGIARLARAVRMTPGLVVASFSFVLIALVGVLGWYGVPTLVRGINEVLTGYPEGLKRLTPWAQEWLGSWKARLEALFPGQGPIEDVLKKKLPDLAGPGSQAARILLSTIFGSLVAVGHFLLFLVLTAILTAEWDKNTAKGRHLVELYAPRQAKALIAFGEKFQKYGAELFVGIGIVMLIFMPIFFALLYFYAGLSLGKSLLYGIILGATSAVPTVGGIITYLLVVVIGLLNLGMDSEALWKIGVLYVVSFVVHFFETKFVTPRVLGHRISFTSFAVITVLVASVLLFGIGRGILAGLFLLVALRAITEVADEVRAAGGPAAVAPAAPPVGAQAALAVAEPVAKPPPQSAAPLPPKFAPKAHRRRGRR